MSAAGDSVTTATRRPPGSTANALIRVATSVRATRGASAPSRTSTRVVVAYTVRPLVGSWRASVASIRLT